MEWQPIETAPRNGTKILISDGENVDVGWFATWDRFWGVGEISGWAINWNREFNEADETMIPTHWMPRPPPSSKEPEAK